MTLTLRKRTIVLLLVLAAVLAAGAAIASWSVSSSGNASSKAGSATPVVLSDASGSTSGTLYPGGSGTLTLKVSNPNGFPVRITAVSLTSGGTITSTSAPCDAGPNGVTLTNQSGLTLDLAANAPATVFNIAGAVQMAGSSPNACQGAVFTIPVDVTATSN